MNSKSIATDLLVPRRIVPSVNPSELSTRKVRQEFSDLLKDGSKLKVSGEAKPNPERLLERKLHPKHKIELFDTTFYLTDVRQIPELRFFVAYVVQTSTRQTKPTVFARIFYKDLSLVWRSASHFTFLGDDIWVGKGDVRYDDQDGLETVESIESTTDLPLEMQSALESLLPASGKKTASGNGILELVLRKSRPERVEPFADFVNPRRKAQSNPKNLINKGKPVATFKKPGSPETLRIVKGYEPDFLEGVIERFESKSKLYGGTLRRFRILSTNRKIQYYFFAGAKHVWIVPPQATTTDLSSYGVRTIDVNADDDLFIPGYEYHHLEETANGTELYSQIPVGFAGDVCPADEWKADASPWLDRLPLIKKFRETVLT